MKQVLAALLVIFLLTGCGDADAQMDRAMLLRENLLQRSGCTFDAVITADYGEKLYTFTMNCTTNSAGDLDFAVLDPQTISGITGTVSAEGGALTFDDQVLAFELLADDQVTPVSTPWLMIQTLRSGYLRSCTSEEGTMRIIIDDSYGEEALQLDIWVDGENLPTEAEILWQGRRVVSLEVKNFSYL